eukprot:COSAG01_NODE_3270_length_6327_cov_112.729929_1_plen_69_part_00
MNAVDVPVLAVCTPCSQRQPAGVQGPPFLCWAAPAAFGVWPLDAGTLPYWRYRTGSTAVPVPYYHSSY